VLNPTFCSLNRNKKSITLNLKTVEAQGIFLELADGADVIIENQIEDRLKDCYPVFLFGEVGSGVVGGARKRPLYPA